MGQVQHGSATTTAAVRRAIQHSEASLRALAARYGINPKTVAKWKKRTSTADRKTGPSVPKSTVLSAADEAVIVAFRRHTLLPLDDCLYALQPTIPHLAQSTFSAVIDTLSAPVLLAASDLRLIHANPTARQMLRAADLIRARDGFIVAVATGVSRAIAAAVLQAARDESALGRRGLGIPVTSDDGRKGALHVLPLRRSRMTADGQAVAAIFVAQADHSSVPPTEVFAALFGLAPAESVSSSMSSPGERWERPP